MVGQANRESCSSTVDPDGSQATELGDGAGDPALLAGSRIWTNLDDVRLPLFPTLLTFSLAACAGHAVRPAGDTGAGTPAAAPPVAAPGPATSPPPEARPRPAEPSGASTGSPAIDIRRIGQWYHTGILEPRRQVIQDPNAWAQFWSELGMGEQPEVDFTRDLVIAVASGQHRTGGFSIAVEQVTQQGGELTIRVVETTPGPDCVTTSELTQPVEAVAIPVVQLFSWHFVERKATSDCR
jgi:protease stability complex PrcB-like protein